MALTGPEIGLIGICLDALGKIIAGHTIGGGKPATPQDVEEAKTRLDKTKADLDSVIEEKLGT